MYVSQPYARMLRIGTWTVLLLALVVAAPWIAHAGTSAFTQSATSVDHDSARLNGTVFPSDDAAIVAWFEWGEDTNTPHRTPEQFVDPGGGGVSFLLSGLSEETTYFYRIVVRATGSGSEETRGSLFSFTTTRESENQFGPGAQFEESPPIAFTLNATSVSKKAATLNGFADTGDDTTFWFEWGTTRSLGRSTSAVNVDEAFENISRRITGLEDGETYYFRAVARNAEGTSQGGILQFTADGEAFISDNDDDKDGGSPSAPTSPFRPRVQTRDAFTIGNAAAILQGRVDNIRGDKVSAWFQWGKSEAFGNVTIPQTFNVNTFSVSSNISGLKVGETYYFRAVAENDYGIGFGETLVFTVGGGTQGGTETFRVFTTEAAEIGSAHAVVGGIVVPRHSGTSAHIAWGKTRALGARTDAAGTIHVGSANSFAAPIRGLAPNTTYYYQAVALGGGEERRGSVLSFRTQGTGGDTGPAPTPGPLTRAAIFLEVQNTANPNGTDTALAAASSDILEYRIQVRNAGTTNLSGVAVFERLSPFLEFISTSDGGQYDETTRMLRWEIGTLRPRAQKTLSLRVAVRPFSESAVAEQNFIIESGDLLKRSNTVQAVLSIAPLIFTISADPNDVDPGERVTYRARLENTGEGKLERVELRLNFPEGLSYVSSDDIFRTSGSTALLSVGDIAAREKREIVFDALVANTTRQGEGLALVGITSYTDTLLDERGDITAIATVVIGGRFFGGSASLFGSGFFPSTLVGWLALLLLLVLLVLLGVKLYELFVAAKRESRDLEHAQNPPLSFASGTNKNGVSRTASESKPNMTSQKMPEASMPSPAPTPAPSPEELRGHKPAEEEEEEVLRISDLPRE